MDISKIRLPQGVILPKPAFEMREDYNALRDAYKDGHPIILFGTVTAQSGADEVVNAMALKNPTPYPIEIHEIRFHGYSVNSAMGAGIVGVQFILPDQTAISDSYIPWWLFDRSVSLWTGESNPTNSGGLVTGYASAGDYIWALNTPLILMPGELLTPKLAHFGLIVDNISMQITYSGRVRASLAKPTTRIVPFVAAWQAPPIDFSYVKAQYVNGGANDYQIINLSPENALINSSNSKVVIKRLTGRLLALAGSTSVYSDETQPVVDMLVNVNMQTSYGYQITRDYVPFRLLFARDTRDFPCELPLNPGEFLLAQIQAVQGDISPYGEGGGVYTFPTFASPTIPQIGMVGEREVSL